MTEYGTTVTIAAPPERVWEILTDGENFARWNSTVVSLEGSIAEGETIALVSTVNPKRTFKLKVSQVDAPTSMVWSDGMPMGLFAGVRTFTLGPTDDGGTEFSMREAYSGLLAGLITKSIPDMTESFEAFAADLRTQAETSN